MSGVRSFLFWFPGPGARGSRSVGLWVTKTGSCQGYHDGTPRYGWLRVAGTTQQNNEHAVPALVETVPVSVDLSSRGASGVVLLSSVAAVVAGPSWLCSGSTETGRPRRGRGVSGQEGAGRWTGHGTNVAKWEAGKANGCWGCWSHTADAGWRAGRAGPADQVQPAGSWWPGTPG